MRKLRHRKKLLAPTIFNPGVTFIIVYDQERNSTQILKALRELIDHFAHHGPIGLHIRRYRSNRFLAKEFWRIFFSLLVSHNFRSFEFFYKFLSPQNKSLLIKKTIKQHTKGIWNFSFSFNNPPSVILYFYVISQRFFV